MAILGFGKGGFGRGRFGRRGGATHGATGNEAKYLKQLSDRRSAVTVKLGDGEQVQGWIEYFDDSMIRLTRTGSPNLLIYKQQVLTITELRKRTSGNRAEAAGLL
jgi:host factor-I protein